jgi:hypothetical protein
MNITSVGLTIADRSDTGMTTLQVKPVPSRKIGEILRQAYLITPTQLEEALREQKEGKNQKLGEILARKGWIKQETADFFAHKWESILREPKSDSREPLGFYLKEAGLLNDDQIRAIVAEQGQKSLWIRLGTMAVLKGWLAQSTIDFFIEHLYPEHATDSPFVKPRDKKAEERYRMN